MVGGRPEMLAAGASARAESAPRRIAMLIYPQAAPLDIVGPLQVFGVANALTRKPLYEILTVAPTAGAIATRLGFAILPAFAMDALPLPVDTLLVSGGSDADSGADPAISDWLARAAPHARRVGSICTGAFALAAAGLVDGREVTTHWAFAEELSRRHPLARVDADRIYVRDGKVCSSAGISAGIDLALALVEEDQGRQLALEVARYLVLFLKRSGGQSQFSTQLQAQFSQTPAIREVQLWCLNNLTADLRIGLLARRAAMSERSFLRKFTDETGRTPSEFITSARLDAARRLLEESDLELKVVAERCGLGSLAALRRLFLGQLGVSPGHYREKFQQVEPAAATRAAAHAPA